MTNQDAIMFLAGLSGWFAGKDRWAPYMLTLLVLVLVARYRPFREEE